MVDMVTYSRIRPIWKQIEMEIEGMVGLPKNKKQLIKLVNRIKNSEMLSFLGQTVPIPIQIPNPIHLAFMGKRGTGKSTVAKILGKVFYVAGCLRSPTTVEMNIDHRNLMEINSARGGVLLLDVTEKMEAMEPMKINALISIMDSGDTIVIFAGRRKRVEKMLTSNDQLYDRLSKTIRFRDYTTEDVIKIIQYKMANEYSSEENRIRRYKWDRLCTNYMAEDLLEGELSEEFMAAHNGYLADRILFHAIRNLRVRTKDVDDESDAKITISYDDLEIGILVTAMRNGCAFPNVGG